MFVKKTVMSGSRQNTAVNMGFCFNSFLQYLGNVGLGGQSNHDIQLLQLDIDGIVVFDKEHLDFLLQDLRPGY